MGHGSSRAVGAGRKAVSTTSSRSRKDHRGSKKQNSLHSSLESGLSISDGQICNCECIYCQRTCDCNYSDLESVKELSKTTDNVDSEDNEELYSVCDQNPVPSQRKQKVTQPLPSIAVSEEEKGSSNDFKRHGSRTLLEMKTQEQEEVLSTSVLAYDEIVNGAFAAFLKSSQTLGGDVAKQAELVNQGVAAQRKFLVVVSRSKKPSDADLPKLLQPMSESIMSIQSYREKNRTSPLFNHLSAISESIPALGWVAVAPAPAPYIKEMNDAGQFYTNRVLKDWKEKDKNHVDWARSWILFLTELQAFVKQHHTTGLTWNNKGGDAMQNASKAGPTAAAKPSAGGPPPPPPPPGPPPPPMPSRSLLEDAASAADASRAQLFAALNKGDSVTKGLKKVTSDMQTHKNPSLRSGAVVPASGKPAISTKPSPPLAGAPTVRPPRMELDGKKWIVEYQNNQSGLTISDTGMNQTVYVFKCEGSTIRVNGKVNSIVLDSCKKTGVVLDSVVSSVEFVNCQSVQMQVLNKVPTVSIDKTDGCQIYLNDQSLDVSIVSAKSSEMNVLVPKDGDFVEFAIPEQFKTTYNGKGLTTVMTESV